MLFTQSRSFQSEGDCVTKTFQMNKLDQMWKKNKLDQTS